MVLDVAQHSSYVRVDPPEEEEDSSVVLGTERLDVAGAPLEPSPSAELTGPAEEWSALVPPRPTAAPLTPCTLDMLAR